MTAWKTGDVYESLNQAQEAERNARIWQMRLDNRTQAEIGAEVGLSQAQISRILNQMAKERVTEEIDTWLKMQLDKLDKLADRYLSIAMREHIAHNNGRVVRHPETNEIVLDDGPSLAAYSKYLDVVREQSKLLGLYAPEKSEVKNTHEINPDILNRIKMVEESDNG